MKSSNESGKLTEKSADELIVTVPGTAEESGTCEEEAQESPKIEYTKAVYEDPEDSRNGIASDFPEDTEKSVAEETARPVFSFAGRFGRNKDGIKENRVRSRMTDISVALLPLVAWGTYLFGPRVITLTLISVISCVLLDILSGLILKSGNTAPDLTSAVIGITTVLCMPPTAPLWLPAAAAFVSVVLIKNLAWKLTRIRLDPTAVSVTVMYIVFPSVMNALCKINIKLPAFSMTAGNFKTESVSILGKLFSGTLPKEASVTMFAGLRTGAIGEMSALMITAGFIYLCIRKIQNARLPLTFVITFAVLSYLFPKLAIASDTIALMYTVSHLLSGNMLFCTMLMTMYPGSCPRSPRARTVSGFIGGVSLFLIRYFISPAADALIVVLIINLTARPLDILFGPSVFGGRLKK